MKAVEFTEHGGADVHGDSPDPVRGRDEVLAGAQAGIQNHRDRRSCRGLPGVATELPRGPASEHRP